MSKRQVTATITDVRDTPEMAYLRIEATNGKTFARVTDKFPKRPDKVMFSVWTTDSREIDIPCTLRDMPKAVRVLFQSNKNPFAT